MSRALFFIALLLVGCVRTIQHLGDNGDAGAMAAPRRLAAGQRTTMVIASDGLAWAWGIGTSGQLAIVPASLPSTCAAGPCTSAPMRSPALDGADDIALGRQHGCALRAGRVSCWGLNITGALGNGVAQDMPTPIPVDVGITDAIGIACGDWHSCAIHADGGVSCWGLAFSGQTGQMAAAIESCTIASDWATRFDLLPFPAGPALPCSLVPRRVPGLANVRALALGRDHSCARLASGDVVCFGDGRAGQLGDGSMMGSSLVPVLAAGGAGELASGSFHACTVIGGGLSCWGDDHLGQIGILPAPSTCAEGPCAGRPAALAITPVMAIGAGDRHTCVIRNSDAVCFGASPGAGAASAACENGACVVPAAIIASDVRAPIAAGTDHTCTSALDGSIACWGGGAGGQLGVGQADSLVPVHIELR